MLTTCFQTVSDCYAVPQKKRKTDRPTRILTDEKTMRSAVGEVIGGRAVNTVAREKGIDRMTLKRYVRKFRLNPSMI